MLVVTLAIEIRKIGFSPSFFHYFKDETNTNIGVPVHVVIFDNKVMYLRM